MKRLTAAVVAACMLLCGSGAGAVSVTEVTDERNGNAVTFSGKASGTEQKLMVKVYNTEYGEDNTDGFVKLDTVKTDAEGNFEFTVVIPDILGDGSDSTGEYEIVWSDGESPARQTFLYANTDAAAGVTAVLESENSDTIYAEMEGDFSDNAAMTGIDTETYKKLSAEKRRTVCDMFVSARDGGDTAKLFNRCIYSQYISVCEEDERVFTAERLAPVYNDIMFDGLSDTVKEKTATYMSGASIANFDDVSRVFGEGVVLSNLSEARKDDIPGILSENLQLLGLENSDVYSRYSGLSASARQKANEQIVAEIGGRMITVSELASIISSAVQSTQSGTGNTGGTSSPGGGGAIMGGSNTSVPNATHIPQNGGQNTSENGQTEGTSEEFTDLGGVEWAADAIQSLAGLGIVNGVGDGRFTPAESVTREAFVKMLLLASGMFENGHASSFSDVDASQWYAEYVACAFDIGIVTGISDTEFGIGMTITRQDMAVMLERTADSAGIEIEKIRDYDGFTDSSEIADYAAEAIERLCGAGILNGMGDGRFCPTAPLTRAEAAKVIYDMFVNKESESASGANSSNNVTDSNFERNMRFLKGVDVMTEDTELSPSDMIKAGAFINMAVSLMQDNTYGGETLDSVARSIAEGYGMIPGDVTDSGTLTVRQAAEILVKAAGYGQVITNGQYFERAGSLGILNGISQSAEETLRSDTAVAMVVNASESIPAVVAGGAANPEISILSNTTLLEQAKGIYKSSGVVTGNNITTLYSPEGLPDGRIEIDNISYSLENRDYYKYIGYNVTYYADTENNDRQIKYMEPRDGNNVTEIDADDISRIEEDLSSVTYYDGDREKTINISDTPNLIFNERYYGEYTEEDLDIEAGSVKIIKSDSTDRVDTVMIESYETMVFDRLSNDDSVLFNKFSYSGATESLDFNDAVYDITKNGETITLADLKEWDVLSVAVAKSGFRPYYKILVSDTREDAVTESYSYGDMTVTSIGYIYDIANCYFNSFNENKGVGQTLELGRNQTYLLDAFGRVAVVLDESSEDDGYMYIANAWMNEDGDSAGIKYYDINNQEFIRAELGTRVVVNGERYDGGDIPNSPLFNADGEASPQLAKIYTDNDGQITNIETAVSATGTDSTGFTRKNVSNTWIYENSSFNYEAFLTGNAKVLCVPDNGSEEDDFYVLDRSMYENDQVKGLASSVTAYDMDEFMRTDMVVVNYSNNAEVDMSDSLDIFMVEKILDAVDEEGNEMRLLRGSIGNYEGMEFYIKDDNMIPNVAPGDALYVRFDKKGKISSAEIIFSLNDMLNSEDPYNAAKTTRDTGNNTRTQLVTGWIYDADLTAGEDENMLMLDGTSMLPIRLNGSSSKVIVYDADNKKTTVEDVNAIEKDDIAIVRLRYSVVRAIVIIKNAM